MSFLLLGAGPCRPGIAGATRPGSDFLYDVLFLTLNSRGTRARAKLTAHRPLLKTPLQFEICNLQFSICNLSSLAPRP